MKVCIFNCFPGKILFRQKNFFSFSSLDKFCKGKSPKKYIMITLHGHTKVYIHVTYVCESTLFKKRERSGAALQAHATPLNSRHMTDYKKRESAEPRPEENTQEQVYIHFFYYNFLHSLLNSRRVGRR